MNRYQLLEMINKVSFAMDDTRLFLDTHPDCETALDYFKMLREKRHELVKEYTEQFGQIVQYGIDDDACEWTWNQGPLPWEIGGCK